MSGRPAFPQRVQVGAITYTLTYDATMGDLGETQPDKQRIALRPGQAPDYLADTVLHELLHAMLAHTPLDLTHEQEEAICLTLAPALLDTLRRNAALADFLLDRG